MVRLLLLIVDEEQPCTSDMPSVSVQATPEVSSVSSRTMPNTSSVDIQVSPEVNSVQGFSEVTSTAIRTLVRCNTISVETSYVYILHIKVVNL